MINDRCFRVRGVYGNEEIELRYNKQKSIVDLDPFLRNIFSIRDRVFGVNPGLERRTIMEREIIYNFRIPELAEAFLGSYTPDELGDFFEAHLEDSLPSESLIYKIRNIEKDMRRVRLDYIDGVRYLSPIGLSMNDLKQIMHENLPKSYFSKTIHRRRSLQGHRPDEPKELDGGIPLVFRSRFEPVLRNRLLRQNPPIFFSITKLRLNLLDPFEMIKHYDLPTDHLIINRKNTVSKE
jgi:hypothetical protein